MNNFIDFPTLYLVTGEPSDDKKKFLEYLEISLNSGIKLVQVRAKSLDKQAYQKLAVEAVRLCHQYHAKALLSVHKDLIKKTGADGVHLPSAELMKLAERPIGSEYLLSVACHDVKQIRYAAQINADFAVVSPIFSTPSSPMGNPLGWEKFSSLAAVSKIPLYALGGMTRDHIEIARAYGAFGIAAIQSVWGVMF